LCVVFAGVLFFIQLLPVTICCFEYYKWQQTVSAWHAALLASGKWWQQMMLAVQVSAATNPTVKACHLWVIICSLQQSLHYILHCNA
jgi:hypothetical protein